MKIEYYKFKLQNNLQILLVLTNFDNIWTSILMKLNGNYVSLIFLINYKL